MKSFTQSLLSPSKVNNHKPFLIQNGDRYQNQTQMRKSLISTKELKPCLTKIPANTYQFCSTVESDLQKAFTPQLSQKNIAQDSRQIRYQSPDSQMQQDNEIDELRSLIRDRCSNLEQIVEALNEGNPLNMQNYSDITKFQELLCHMSTSLQQATNNEIELANKLRDNERKNIQISTLKLKHLNLSEKNNQLQKQIDLISGHNSFLSEDNNRLQRLLNIEKKQNSNNIKKVATLEKRVEFLLENEVSEALNPKDKMRNSLNELLKENECIKRELQHKKQELERDNGKLNQQTQIVYRLQQTIENMKQKGLDESAQKGEQIIYKKDDINLLSNFKIPQSLDFRLLSLKFNQQNLINDFIERGTIQAVNQILQSQNQDQQKEQFYILGNQMIKFKEFSDKINRFNYDVEQFQISKSLEELIISVNRFLPVIFQCEIVRLWVLDGMNGCIYTVLDNNKQLRALSDKGLIGDVFRSKKAINITHASQKPLVYKLRETELAEYTKNSMLLPVFCENNNQVMRGILEVSNGQQEIFSFDEEYFGIIISHHLSHIMQRLIDQQVWKISQKYKSLLMEAFALFMQTHDKIKFTQVVLQQVQHIFGIKQSVFYFIEDAIDNTRLLVNHIEDTQYPLSYGLAGIVATDKQGFIINDIKRSTFYNEKVDLKSVLPIYAIPLINEQGNVSAVLEIVLKSKINMKLEKDHIIKATEGIYGMEEPLSKQLDAFVGLIVSALSHIKFINPIDK